MGFTPGSELLEARARLSELVDVALARLAAGESTKSIEREQLDLKEGAGRRGFGGILLPGTPTNSAAADHLADEVACMANTPSGGVLIVGVEDNTGSLLGASMANAPTALSTLRRWSRSGTYEACDY